jgi:outer membrane protein assembly factor BamA
MTPRILLLALALICAGDGSAGAQTTRTELLERQREEKARRLAPYQPGRLERGLFFVENGGLARVLAEPVGWYPRFGGVTNGSGIAMGPGYRRPFAGDHAVFNVSAAFSAIGYKVVDGSFALPRVAGDRVGLTVNGRYRYFPQEDFFGPGIDAPREARTSFLLESTEFWVDAAYRPAPWLYVGGETGHLNARVGRGRDPRFPSIETSFTEAAAPGLFEQPDFLHGRVFAGIDYRDAPLNARSGGHYYVAVARYADRDLHRHSFRQTTVSAAQFLPLLEKKRVIALRALAVLSNPDAAHRVPFYLQPTLGGHDTLRGFRSWRFRDANLLLLTGEYRWEAFAGLDMALFVDAGSVAADRSDLSAFQTNYGLGFRFNAADRVFLRIDIARSREGLRYFLKFGPVF